MEINVFFHRDLNEAARQVVLRTLSETFSLKIRAEELDESLDFAFNPARDQYNADEIAEWALRNLPRMFLLVVPFDIYSGMLNFVFGIALFGNGAIISTYRFRFPGLASFEERLIKTVKHEMGHVFGLQHCNNVCVMKFANSLLELDIKHPSFCDSCAARLRALGVLKRL